VVSRPARRLIGVMLVVAVLDLTRCGLVMLAVRHPAPAAGLVVAVLAAVGRTGVPGDDTQSPCVTTGDYVMTAMQPRAPAQRSRGS
jgi:hypothetical protein